MGNGAASSTILNAHFAPKSCRALQIASAKQPTVAVAVLDGDRLSPMLATPLDGLRPVRCWHFPLDPDSFQVSLQPHALHLGYCAHPETLGG